MGPIGPMGPPGQCNCCCTKGSSCGGSSGGSNFYILEKDIFDVHITILNKTYVIYNTSTPTQIHMPELRNAPISHGTSYEPEYVSFKNLTPYNHVLTAQGNNKFNGLMSTYQIPAYKQVTMHPLGNMWID
jgi:hypothetical protein